MSTEIKDIYDIGSVADGVKDQADNAQSTPLRVCTSTRTVTVQFTMIL